MGFIHIEDISVTRIRHPMERFNIGDKIQVVLKRFIRDTGRIMLSYKELFGSWEQNIQYFKENTAVIGIVRNQIDNGVFVELRPNLVGLADQKIGVKYGDKVSVFIKKIIPEKQRVKLVIIGNY